MLHIIVRFLLHFGLSCTFTLVFYFLIRYWQIRNSKVIRWISFNKNHRLVVSALLVFALFPLREPYDIWMQNNSFIKSCFDQVSWLIGPAVAVFGLSRFDIEEA